MSVQKTSPRPFLTDRTYNVLKWIAQIFLPGLATFYFTISETWNLPHGAEIVGTMTAFDLFLGLLLGVSTAQYNKSDARYDGEINVLHEDGIPYRMEGGLNELENPMDLVHKKEVVFKVVNTDLQT